jgi:hypothetical protein
MARGSDQDISEIKQRLALIESRLEQVFEKLDKRYHELTGAGLKESKDAVDRLGG